MALTQPTILCGTSRPLLLILITLIGTPYLFIFKVQSYTISIPNNKASAFQNKVK